MRGFARMHFFLLGEGTQNSLGPTSRRLMVSVQAGLHRLQLCVWLPTSVSVAREENAQGQVGPGHIRRGS